MAFLFNIYILFIISIKYDIYKFIKNAKISVHLSFYYCISLV